MLKASSLLVLVISVLLAAAYIAVRYFGVEIPYVPYVHRQPELVLLIAYALVWIGYLIGLPGSRRGAAA